VTLITGLVALGLLVVACLTGAPPLVHRWGEARAMPASPLALRATPESTPVLVGPFEIPGAVPVSLVIQNAGEAERLLGGSTPVAERVEVRQTRLVAGRRVSAPAPQGIVIPAGESLVLEPAASHLLLFGLHADLVQGKTFPLTLRFEHAGMVTVTVRVRRKVDAAGVEPIAPVIAGDLRLSLASAPPAQATTADCRNTTDVSC
jgi:copper(I)-binding protein